MEQPHQHQQHQQSQQPRLIGLGYSVPPNRRTNDDPIFDWLKAHVPPASNPFQGYKTRAVLAPGEDLMTVMMPAALNALEDAKLQPSDIDMLLGYASVSPYATPNELSRLHRLLGLPEHAWVVPLNCEFSNFNAGLVMADALVRAGRARNVLIVAGGDWTRHVDYHTVQSISAADGAGAAVVGASSDRSRWQVIDQQTVTETSYFGSMFMRGQSYAQTPPRDGHQRLWSDPFFQITAEGMQGFAAFGGTVSITAVTALLARHQIPASSVTLIAHQASTVLLDRWQATIQPGQVIQTIADFANMTVANIPVNLAWSVANDPISKDHLVLFALGPDMHANAVLLERA
jgi:3-oxoacyl-[acyl-carrier-protein] synthase III